MKDSFKEFYFEKDDENIWVNSIIVLDTNVLLNLYRYSRDTTNQILTLLEKYEHQLWMPHQVALEYHYNRKKVITEQKDSYQKVCDSFEKIFDKIRNILNEDLKDFKKRHKEDIELFISNLRNVSEKQVGELKENIKHEPDLLRNDFIKDKITKLYDNRVGNPFSKEKILELEKEADKRFINDIPPGYKDFKKKSGIKYFNELMLQDKYGDFILWKQVIDYAKEKNANVIFLTDEQKEDWWYKLKGQIIGPRIELLNEFYFNTGKQFYMFSSIGFIERNEDIVDKNAASEVKEISTYYNFYQSDFERDLAMKNRDELTKIHISFVTRDDLPEEDMVDLFDEFFHRKMTRLEPLEYDKSITFLYCKVVLEVNDEFDNDDRLNIKEELIDFFDAYDIELLQTDVTFLN